MAIGEHLARLLTHHGVLEDGRVGPGQVPGLEKGRPVDRSHELLEGVAAKLPTAERNGRGGIGTKCNGRCIGPGLCKVEHLRVDLVGMPLAQLVVVGRVDGQIGLLG